MDNRFNQPSDPDIQSTGEINIIKNGEIFHNLDDLSPEARQKIQAALAKISSNPNLASFVSTFSALAKNSKELGGSAMPISFEQSSQPQSPSTPSSQTNTTSPITPPIFNRQQNPNFNPHLSSDNLRRDIFIIAVTLLIGFLIIKFGFNGQLPF